MKAMIIPIAIGLLAGLGGGSGYAYMQASAKFAVDSARLAEQAKAKADSAAHDSTAGHEGGEHAPAADSVAATDAVPMTPADSLRALDAARKGESHGGASSDHAPGKGTAAAPAPARHDPEAKPAAGGHDAPTTKLSDVKVPNATPPAPKGASASTASAAATVKDARDQALQTALPEARLAKIFGAMAAKDAAKVLDQMTDGDIRAILAMMNDRQAAAILSALPAARAAAITKGAVKP
jgi:hypothetical protein